MIFDVKNKVTFSNVLISLLGFCILYLVCTDFLAPILQHVSQLYAYPFEWDPYEGLTSIAVQAIREGKSPYTDPFALPLTTYPYPPLYPALVSLFPQGTSFGLIPARWISTFFFVGILLTTYLIALEIGISKPIALFSLVFLLTNIDIAIWFPLARNDSTYLFLAFLGVWIILRPNRRDNRMIWALGMFALILACFAKHAALPFLLVGLVPGFIRRPFRKPMIALLSFSVLGLVLYTIHIDEHLLASLIKSNLWDIELSRVGHFLLLGLKQYPMMLLGTIGFVSAIRKRGWRDTFCLTAMASLGFLFLIGHRGSSINYLMAPLVVLTIGIAYLAMQFPISSIKRLLVLLSFILIHLLIAGGTFVLNSPSPQALKKMTDTTQLLTLSTTDPLVEVFQSLSLHARHKAQVDLAGSRDRYRQRFGKDNWEIQLASTLSKHDPYDMVIAGKRLGSFYQKELSTLVPVGRINLGAWYGSEDFVALLHPKLIPKLKERCRFQTIAPYFCQRFQSL